MDIDTAITHIIIQNMSGLFSEAGSFNTNISAWNVSNVEDMGHMFSGTGAFNQDLSLWDVSRVASMKYMFQEEASERMPLFAFIQINGLEQSYVDKSLKLIQRR